MDRYGLSGPNHLRLIIWWRTERVARKRNKRTRPSEPRVVSHLLVRSSRSSPRRLPTVFAQIVFPHRGRPRAKLQRRAHVLERKFERTPGTMARPINCLVGWALFSVFVAFMFGAPHQKLRQVTGSAQSRHLAESVHGIFSAAFTRFGAAKTRVDKPPGTADGEHPQEGIVIADAVGDTDWKAMTRTWLKIAIAWVQSGFLPRLVVLRLVHAGRRASLALMLSTASLKWERAQQHRLLKDGSRDTKCVFATPDTTRSQPCSCMAALCPASTIGLRCRSAPWCPPPVASLSGA